MARTILNCREIIRGIQEHGGSMKRLFSPILCVCLVVLLGIRAQGTAFAAATHDDLQERIDAAKLVLDQIMGASDSAIPKDILQQATCVGVVPGMKKGAFLVGVQYGQGVVTCRTGRGWSAPVFIRMAGGSFGFQAGGESTDLILVAVNDRGFQDLLKSKFKIGGDASAAAGPVGRDSQAATDWKMSAELLTYSRSKGLFAGIDLDGTSVSQNTEDTQTYYGGQALGFGTILKGDVAVPEGAKTFVRTVAKAFIASKQ
jgi:lipid-binding SYLF domain-containing protein